MSKLHEEESAPAVKEEEDCERSGVEAEEGAEDGEVEDTETVHSSEAEAGSSEEQGAIGCCQVGCCC